MTSTFDTLASFDSWLKQGKLTEEEVEEVFTILDLAVKQAGSRKPTKWNFDLWMGKRWKDMTEEGVDEFFDYKGAAKFSFLSTTHSVLDHSDDWHLKVFNRDLLRRIEGLSRSITRRLRETT